MPEKQKKTKTMHFDTCDFGMLNLQTARNY